MNRSLLRLVVTCSFVSIVAVPLQAQYLFIDANHDGVCDFLDIPKVSTLDSLDVWIDTSRNADGSPAACSTGEALTIASYELLFRTDVNTVIRSWTNARPEFPTEEHRVFQTGAAWVGYYGSTHLAPGPYLLGRLGYEHTSGCPYVNFAYENQALPGAQTGFLSQCSGSQLDNFIRLGTDFLDACGVVLICDDVKSTTWGHIKEIYR